MVRQIVERRRRHMLFPESDACRRTITKKGTGRFVDENFIQYLNERQLSVELSLRS